MNDRQWKETRLFWGACQVLGCENISDDQNWLVLRFELKKLNP